MSNIYSVALDGNDAYSAVNHADFRPTGAFTVGGWLKTSTTGAAQTIFISYSENTNIAGIRFGINTANKIRFRSGRNTGGSQGTDWQIIDGGTTVTDGVWHWAVGVWDTAKLQLYLDGSSDAADVAWANAPAYAATNYVRVGCSNETGTNIEFITGSLDEVFLINGTAWSAATVASYYRKFIEGATNLVAYYQLENNGNDSTAGAHTLTDISDPAYQGDVPFIGAGTMDLTTKSW